MRNRMLLGGELRLWGDTGGGCARYVEIPTPHDEDMVDPEPKLVTLVTKM